MLLDDGILSGLGVLNGGFDQAHISNDLGLLAFRGLVDGRTMLVSLSNDVGNRSL